VEVGVRVGSGVEDINDVPLMEFLEVLKVIMVWIVGGVIVHKVVDIDVWVSFCFLSYWF